MVGDNGAGKSTLIRTLSGIRAPDQGEVQVNGKIVHIDGSRGADELGIVTVFQDLALCDELDVVANLFLGSERRTRVGLLDEELMEARTTALLASLNARTIPSPRTKVAKLSGGQRQSVAIARALIGNPKVVLLDEPTAALGVAQTTEVLALIKRLKDNGIGVILVSHNMADVFQVSDRVQVLRLGRCNGIFRSEESSSEEVISAITGATIAGSDAA